MDMTLALPGIVAETVQTSRLSTHILRCGDAGESPVVLLHGNFASSVYFEELMLALPVNRSYIAVDLRGYGLTEDLPVDATRGASDWSDDLFALFDALGISSAHILGWSLGAGVAMQFMLAHPERVESLALVAPISPFGFGGTRDEQGRPCHSDYAGAGAGMVNTEFVAQLLAKDRGVDSPFAPRNVIRQTFVHQPFQFSREEQLLSASLAQRLGEKRYPGDFISSENWPHIAPGKWGPINAVSAKYFNVSGIVDLTEKPPVLWVRGDKDVVTGDRSLSDPAVLGEMKILSGWPGPDIFPAQPMVFQTRAVLDSYQAKGGRYREVVMENVGHSPFLEDQAGFIDAFVSFLDGGTDL